MALLKKDWARDAMEAVCQRTADGLCFRLPRIPHTVAVMVMALAFHTEDPDRVGDTLNIFLFPEERLPSAVAQPTPRPTDASRSGV